MAKGFRYPLNNVFICAGIIIAAIGAATPVEFFPAAPPQNIAATKRANSGLSGAVKRPARVAGSPSNQLLANYGKLHLGFEANEGQAEYDPFSLALSTSVDEPTTGHRLQTPDSVLRMKLVGANASAAATDASSVNTPNSKPPAVADHQKPHDSGPASKVTSERARVAPSMLKALPASFIENRGQFDSRVKFQLGGHGPTLWLTNQGIVFDHLRPKKQLHNPGGSDPAPKTEAHQPSSFGIDSGGVAAGPQEAQRLVFSEEFVGANAAPDIESSACQPGVYNYLIGKDPKAWVTHVAAYSEVVYHDVWPGIDLRLHANGPTIEQEFVVKPRADLTKVQIAHKGIDGLRVAEDGSLLVATAFGELRESKPRIYQEIDGKRVAVEGRFKLLGDTTYTFNVNHYQPEYALVIDPTLLYSTFLGGGAGNMGGNVMETATGIAVDSSGNAYITGVTLSTDFPTTTGAFQRTVIGRGGSAFVTKLNPLGSQLIYSTYLVGQNGAGYSSGQGVAVDSAGEAYVVGWALDQGASPGFPTTSSAFHSARNSSHFLTTRIRRENP